MEKKSYVYSLFQIWCSISAEKHDYSQLVLSSFEAAVEIRPIMVRSLILIEKMYQEFCFESFGGKTRLLIHEYEIT